MEIRTEAIHLDNSGNSDTRPLTFTYNTTTGDFRARGRVSYQWDKPDGTGEVKVLLALNGMEVKIDPIGNPTQAQNVRLIAKIVLETPRYFEFEIITWGGSPGTYTPAILMADVTYIAIKM